MSSNVKYYSKDSFRERAKNHGPRIKPSWNCCKCNDGPHTYSLEPACIQCRHIRCGECPNDEGGTASLIDQMDTFHLTLTQPNRQAEPSVSDNAPEGLFQSNPQAQSSVSNDPLKSSFQLEPRLADLISQNSTSLVTTQETMPFGPASFIQNPSAYFDNINFLQRRIFELGKHVMHVDDAWASFEVLEMWPMPENLTILEQANLALMRTRDILHSTITGFQILLDFGLCRKTYNLIVFDGKRPNVVKVVPVSSQSLSLLFQLLDEAIITSRIPPEGDNEQRNASSIVQSLTEILEDIHELINGALPGLFDEVSFVSVIVDADASTGLIKLCQRLYSAQIVLFLGLVSYTTSHISNVASQKKFSSKLCIKTESDDIILELRELNCLQRFTTQPVWTFSRSSYSDQVQESHYISIYLADFKDLWGPISLHYAEESYTNIIKITTRGGIIHASASPSQSVAARSDEVLCHFQSWMENGSDNSLHFQEFSSQQRILIGTPQQQGKLFRPPGESDSPENCMCLSPESFNKQFFSPPFELQTRHPSWKVDERVSQLNAEISYCSANCRRTSLWNILKQKNVQQFLINRLGARCKDVKILLGYFPSDALFNDVWNALTTEGKDMMKCVFQELLEVLRSTGVGEDGAIQAWDLTVPDRLDGRKYEVNWRIMAQDDTSCATFAMITKNCVGLLPRDHRGVLRTEIYLTVENSIPNFPFQHKDLRLTSMNSVAESRPRPDWALTPDDFKQWKVERSEKQLSSAPLTSERIRILDRAQDKAAALTCISKRIAERQAQRKGLSTDGRVEPLPVRAIQTSHPDLIRSTPIRKEKVRAQILSEFGFNNGSGEEVGRLYVQKYSPSSVTSTVLEDKGKLQSANLDLSSCPTHLHTIWKPANPGIMAKIQAMEEAADKKIFKWTRKSREGVVPWAVSRIFRPETPVTYAKEYIRREKLDTKSQVLFSASVW
ncbi:hypothetical protein BGZ60DRAFT_437831 [Tricladium varicosporioides]|nr:hypothetical protein BGZ60DRAFT_437831 [Hymenoscyphus varicosporioides]